MSDKQVACITSLQAELDGLRQQVAELETAKEKARKTEAALQKSGHFLQTIIDAIPNATMVIGLDYRILLANAAVRRMAGGKDPVSSCMACYEVSHRRQIPCEGREHPCPLQAVLREKVPCTSFHHHRDVAGREYFVEVTAAPIFDDEGNVIQIIESCRDVTEQKRAEQALRQSEARYRELYDQAPVGYHELDTEGRIVRVNRTELEMLGYEPEEMLGKHVWEFVDEVEETRKAFEDQVAGNEEPARAFDRNFKKKDGGVIPILIETRLMRDEEGRTIGMRSTLQDITDRKRAEEEKRRLAEQMQQTQKLDSLGILAGGIAHNFNNLLVGILGNADLVMQELPGRSIERRCLERVVESATRAAKLSTQMLMYSGRGRFQVDKADLSTIIEEMGQLLAASVSEEVYLRYQLKESLPQIRADVSQLRQVLISLVLNASEAMEAEGGRITIRTDAVRLSKQDLAETCVNDNLPGGEYVRLTVEDTGCGMDRETVERIFDPFFTTKFTGRGLGLAAVLGIVRGHQAAIRVESVPQQGTKVEVLFPACEARTPEPNAFRWRTNERNGKGMVLLVDDDPSVRDVGQTILSRNGFSVLTAPDGPEAVEIFRQRFPEIACVLLDMSMPSMNGEEVFRKMRELQPEVRVILTSGYQEREIKHRFDGLGLAGFLQKPFRMKGLVEKIRAVTDLSA